MTRYRRVVIKLSGGALAGGIGQPYVTTDCPAVQRALELGADALLVAKQGVDGVHPADPRRDPGAERCDRLAYEDVVEGTGVMAAIVTGEDVGTTISMVSPPRART